MPGQANVFGHRDHSDVRETEVANHRINCALSGFRDAVGLVAVSAEPKLHVLRIRNRATNVAGANQVDRPTRCEVPNPNPKPM